MIKYSIIIPVRYINDFLKRNIEELKQLDYKDFEVIILPDEPEEFDFENDPRFSVIPTGTSHPAGKRNLGSLYAKGEILAFIDDDAYPAKNWLSMAEQVFEETGTYALGGPAMTPGDDCFKEKMSGRVLESYLTSAKFVYRHLPFPPRKINDFPTVNLFVKKDAFEKVGGFLQEFWPGEDTKLCLDLVKFFKQDFVYDPRPIVYHHRREMFKPHLKQISRYGRHRGQFARIFPETSRLPAFFVPSFFVLGLWMGPLVAMLLPVLWKFYFGGLFVYFTAVGLEATRVAIKERSIRAFGFVYWGIFLTHITYGFYFMVGFLKRPKYISKAVDSSGNYSEG
ncbi:hypothetical protein A3K34_03075 [candidate division WWE3 bacterium RIFOXYC1_FULL_40_10]|uniref:Glycosyltransferase 2-like domain-containing protein n=1 Tax=candidate division WWE3 bacterium RIFOXYA2_FULL_46_9 TaxID=1802636 RepID=A0A1F4W081_UNCKA|nr:MAG: hypothetical protein A3K58_03075 [candidate division WWE3 bacterium RIFOXYB1_FULL_40_22]OGC61830.1 MAG: hypothetical protein A3K37_03075 [candidate division WWE3 bacterium RIFOXYA1_FULL_40_11]OGC62847.1 MAG: hypothetical protein A2264_04235 [candidate division WWE3 bacterium RIFOXYA2_FULL_46_9]OGC64302.1 MAG: hypothetical protein A2326_00490 [candidate division WWE3 bacterium RIFOXYB2_FULL_41_6]OGC66213.1 MAG: hypothetical protein A3K34_03075 [candidate division WWE3 bacterium RIFOXYC1_